MELFIALLLRFIVNKILRTLKKRLKIKLRYDFLLYNNKIFFTLKQINMLQNRRIPKRGLLLASLAAFAYYRYSKMTEEQKRNLVSGLKEKGKKLYDEYMPTEIKNMLGKKENPGGNRNYGEGNNDFMG